MNDPKAGNNVQSGVRRPAHFNSYKLLADPFITKGAQKTYRYDGVTADEPNPCTPEVVPQDPRRRSKYSTMWGRPEISEYPRLLFQIDDKYVGDPPPIEVTITSINDNADATFLSELLQKFGFMEQLHVYYHPITKVHLGLARVIFEHEKSAKACVEKLNKSPVMGRILDVFFDPFGNRCKAYFEEQTRDTNLFDLSENFRECEMKPPEPDPKTTGPLPLPAAVPVTVPVVEDPCVSVSPSPRMDLDTRLNLLFPGRAADDFGKLFGFTSNSDEENGNPLTSNKNDKWKKEFNASYEEEMKDFSPLPSPFLRDISYDSDDLGLGRRDQKGFGDDMSLSSLSLEDRDSPSIPLPSTPPNIIDPHQNQNLIPMPSEPVPTQLLYLPPSYRMPMLPSQSYNFFAVPPPLYMNQQVPYGSNYVNPSWTANVQQCSVRNYPRGPCYDASPKAIAPRPVEITQERNPEEEQEKINARLKDAVKARILSELKQTLRRDIQKRLIEAVAYRRIEGWAAEKEKQHKLNLESIGKLVSASATVNPYVERMRFTDTRPPLPSDNDSYAWSQGFRAAIPKLPSFRKKAPSPPRKDEDSRKSQDNDDRCRSKYEDPDSDIQKGTRAPPRRRLRISSSSESSDTEETTTSEESETSNSSSTSSLESFSSRVRRQQPKASIKVDPLLDAESISDDSFSDEDEAKCDEMEIRSTENEAPTPSPSTKINAKADKENESPIKSSGMSEILHDHNYFKSVAVDNLPLTPPILASPAPVLGPKNRRGRKPKAPKSPNTRENATHNGDENSSSNSLLYAKSPEGNNFATRTELEQLELMTEFLKFGIDAEDLNYMKSTFNMMASDESKKSWLATSHWMDQKPTNIPIKNKKNSRRANSSGSCRTEGFFKLSATEKMKQKKETFDENSAICSTGIKLSTVSTEKPGGKSLTFTREARSNQRRLLTDFGTDLHSDLLKFNQLKFRKKNLRFGRSRIHDWGLFAAETIAVDEMVIEYVGEMIRPALADHREHEYAKVGIGSSYLFKIDEQHILDATKCGNLSRFINHSCNPNCYAKIITIEGQKKIVIYSKQQIILDEEITYDYKFPFEDQKIKCLCGEALCRGTLN